MGEHTSVGNGREAKQALGVWVIFILASFLLNATIPFALGADVAGWISSGLRTTLYGAVIYGLLFLVGPVLIVKGWPVVRQPSVLVALLLGVLAAALWGLLPGAAIGLPLVLAYLHWRVDLSSLGLRSSGWQGDLAVLAAIALLYALPRAFAPTAGTLDLNAGLRAGLTRLLANPATTVEYLFYFGFLASRLVRRTGPVLTPILIGLMYLAHEMTNPEYWIEGMMFPVVAVGVALACSLYLWRRSLLPIWLGDGLARFLAGMLG